MAQTTTKRIENVYIQNVKRGDKIVVSGLNGTETLLEVLTTPDYARYRYTVSIAGLGEASYPEGQKFTVLREEIVPEPHPVGTVLSVDGGHSFYYRINETEDGWYVRSKNARYNERPLDQAVGWKNRTIQQWVANGSFQAKVVFDPTKQ